MRKPAWQVFGLMVGGSKMGEFGVPIDFYQWSSQKLQHLYSAVLHIICGILDAELITMVALTNPTRYIPV